MPTTVGELMTQYGSDKNTAHSYGPLYDDLFQSRRESVTAVLEVGVLHGASLYAWRDYFPNALITGMDHWAEPVVADRINTVKCNSMELDQIQKAFFNARVVTPFDIIIDDGSHWISDQKPTWENLKSFLKLGGIYIIEDIQNIDEARPVFEPLGFVMHDLRSVKERGDDCLAVWSNTNG